MASTYDTSLGTEKDWVRLRIGDANSANMYLTDEEIEATILDQTAAFPYRKYFAAAELLPDIYARWNVQGKGIVDKQMSKLRIRRGEEVSRAAAIGQQADALRREGARRMAVRPYAFRML